MAFPSLRSFFFLLGELDTLDFIGDEYVLGFHRHNLIGEFVDADESGDNLTAAGFEVHNAPHVTGLKQVLLVLVGEDMPEIRAIEIRFLTHTVDGEHHGAVSRLLERQACVRAERTAEPKFMVIGTIWLVL